MKKIIISVSIFMLLIISCNDVSTQSIMKGGKVQQKDFLVTMPFEYRFGLIVLKVKISGKTYDFVFDTGAPNVISNELAEKLGLQTLFNQSVSDSQNGKSDLAFTKIDSIEIGGINFLGTGAAIADLNLSNEIKCMKIDGFIGSNLMSKAIWMIDYEAQKITIASSMNSFTINKEAKKIPFKTSFQGTPILKVKLGNSVEQDVFLDLGASGDFVLNKNSMDELLSKNNSLNTLKYIGANSSGLFGLGSLLDSNFTIKVPNISLGAINLSDRIVEFKNKTPPLIGTNFFKKYDIILNWFTNHLILTPKKDNNYSSLSSFGFDYNIVDNQVKVTGMFIGSNAYKEGLKINDTIIKIGEVNYQNFSSEKHCDFFSKKLLAAKGQEIEFTVLRAGKELIFKFKKERLL